MNENTIADLVKKIAQEQNASFKKPEKPISKPAKAGNKLTREDYPLGSKHPELAKSLTGKSASDITAKDVLDGTLKPEDIRISPEVLEYQAQVAESAGKKQFAMNLRRAAEMTRIPDDEVLKLYEMLRPNRSSFEELISAAAILESKYNAVITAKLFKEAAEVYKKRHVLISD